jgi:hypothetical protein
MAGMAALSRRRKEISANSPFSFVERWRAATLATTQATND